MLEPEWRARWGLILAGGDGMRLRPLTRRIAGDERPKQFCTIVGGETLLEQTRRRSGLTVPHDQTLLVVTRTHERFYRALLTDVSPRSVVAQPENRGTAPAILYALLRLTREAPVASVAVFPSDHYVSDDRAFMAHVDAAFRAVRARPDLVILLGIAPEYAEVEYGWIEPAAPIPGIESTAIYRVRRFWEKPSQDLARALLAKGCLWNSFVMVAQATALLALIRAALPGLYAAFATVRRALDTHVEAEAIRALYAGLPEANFSREALGICPPNLAVLPVRGTEWSDLGEPRRALATLASAGIKSEWAECHECRAGTESRDVGLLG